MFVVILITLVVCICAWKHWNGLMNRDNGKQPPYAEGAWPIFGHALMLLKQPEELHKLIQKISMESLRRGGAITLRIIATDVYAITDPADACQVLNLCLQKDVIYDYFKPWIGEGLISASEKVWKPHRKLLNPTFNQIVLDKYLLEVNKQARLLVNELDVKVGKGKFNHAPYVERTTLQTLCSTAMGVDNDEKDTELREKYLKAKSEFSDGLVHRAQTFWLHSEFIYGLSNLKKTQQEHAKTLHKLTNAIINKRKAEMNNKEFDNEVRFKPFLEFLFEMAKNGALTDREVQEEVDTFTFAGSDTLSVTLTIAFLVVGSYLDVQKKIIEELRDVFQGSHRDVEKQDLLKLKYLEAVIKESMRLYPAVSIIGRTMDKDVKISNSTLFAGNRCFVSLYGVNRHSSWGPDAEQFRPERWLDPASLPSHQFFASFGFGKRRCIGANFSIMSVKTILAHVLRSYRVFGDITQLVQRIEVVVRPVARDYISLERRAKTEYIG